MSSLGILSAVEIAEARRICNEATPEPWIDERHDVLSGCPNFVRDNEDNMSICKGATDDDNAFIAQARTLLPRALDSIEALRAENERLRGLLRRTRADVILAALKSGQGDLAYEIDKALAGKGEGDAVVPHD